MTETVLSKLGLGEEVRWGLRIAAAVVGLSVGPQLLGGAGDGYPDAGALNAHANSEGHVVMVERVAALKAQLDRIERLVEKLN